MGNTAPVTLRHKTPFPQEKPLTLDSVQIICILACCRLVYPRPRHTLIEVVDISYFCHFQTLGQTLIATPNKMSFSMSRAFTPVRARFSGAAISISAPRVLASSSTRLYSSTKSAFNPQDIHNISHSPDHVQSKLPSKKQLRNANRFREFDLEGRVFAITGGGRGLGLSMGEALIEAGAKGMQLTHLYQKQDL